ncbi:MAG: molybdenum cofactor biosynthesis protein B [Candidatus Bathyarchaeia archaeon]
MSESTKKHKAEAPKKLNFAIFVCSTSRYKKLESGGKIEDESGDLIEALIKNAGHNVALRKIIPDEKSKIEECVRQTLNSNLDAAVFCGGTGIAKSDITIETVSQFLEKTLGGFGEIFRHLSFKKIGSAAILSRALAGVAKGKAFFCIPGSPDAVEICLKELILREAPHILKHARE